MEKRYTAKVPASLTQRLYDAGMPLKVTTEMEPDPYTGKVKKIVNVEPPSYAKTLDWLMNCGVEIIVPPLSVNRLDWFMDIDNSIGIALSELERNDAETNK